MKRVLTVLATVSVLLMASGSVLAEGGSATVGVGYRYLDEEGNRSVNYRTFNEYDGVSLSLEHFRYQMPNGVRFSADLRDITLNNRNLKLGVSKPGLFGLEVTNNQYRRVYDFDGGKFTRRATTGGTAWFYPHKSVRLYGGITGVTRTGEAVDYFSIAPTVTGGGDPVVHHDYAQMYYHGGVQCNYAGRSIQAEFGTNKYDDDINPARNQKRNLVSVNGLVSVPGYEQIVLHGGFRHFSTRFEQNDFAISANTGWGGATLNHKSGLSLRYSFVYDRAGSDSDIVKTDNLANAVYVGYAKQKIGGVTVGYQNDLRDDLYKALESNTYYASAWATPAPQLDLRASLGMRDEEMTDGTRLMGDVERNRYRFSARYRYARLAWLKAGYENTHRESVQLGSAADFDRFLLDGGVTLEQYGNLTVGYAHAVGEYQNIGSAFEFTDDILYGDVYFKEHHNFTHGFGATYYRSKRDLNVESFTLRFSLGYRFMQSRYIEAVYTVHNFDDYLIIDRYYTANIVEIRVTNDISF
jgi:hypothetical protein